MAASGVCCWALSGDGASAIVTNEDTPTVYKISAGWEISALVATDTVGNASQGYSVALSADGTTAIAGGPADNGTSGFAVGAAWVFTRTGDLWTQQGGKLVGTDAVGQSQQGSSVAISADGNTVVVGASEDREPNIGKGPTLHVGAAWVYARTGGVWAQQGSKLVGSDWVGDSEQGRVAISADGNTIIVGGPSDNSGAGAAWVFTRTVGVWTQQGSKLVGTGAAGIAQQGTSVALSSDGNTAVIGANFDNSGRGAAWIFTRTAGIWTQQGSKLVVAGGTGNSGVGSSVAISADGNTVILGGSTSNLAAAGAWVFTRTGGVWTQQAGPLVGTGAVLGPAPNELASMALSADGNTAIIGDAGDNGYLGAAWVFTRSGGVWSQAGGKLVGTGAVGLSGQGQYVAISGDASTVALGGPQDSGTAGATWMFAASMPVSVPVVITTSPSGLNITVDGSPFAAPHTFQWAPGSRHTIAVASPQGGGGTRYVFVAWSDAGSMSHSLTVPGAAITYTATFGTSYLLTTSVSPAAGGTITATPGSPDGYYAKGSSVELKATANSGYQFAGWSGDLTGTSNPRSIIMDSPRRVAATFGNLGDTTPPVITPQIAGIRGSNGWYRSTVVVLWSVSDPESGIASSSGCSASILANETAGVTLTCSATNRAGLSNTVSVTIKIDKTRPRITVPSTLTVFAPSLAGIPVTYTVTASDNLDPHPALTCVPVSGSNFGVGTRTVTCTATDTAGNLSVGAFDVVVVGPDNLVIGQLVSPTVQTGKELRYIIGTANLGPAAAYQVKLSGAIPAGTEFVSASWFAGPCNVGNRMCVAPLPAPACVFAGRTITCDIGTLLPLSRTGVGVGAVLTVRVKAPAGATITNQVTVTGANIDTVPANNVSAVTTAVVR